MIWTSVSKPGAQAYTQVNPMGKEVYDQADVFYDDPNVFYDGINPMQWTDVNKPATPVTWTDVPKPT